MPRPSNNHRRNRNQSIAKAEMYVGASYRLPPKASTIPPPPPEWIFTNEVRKSAMDDSAVIWSLREYIK
nr:expressed protein [Hymenolepis microstoma]